MPGPSSSQDDESYVAENGLFLGTASCVRLEDALSSAVDQAIYERAPRPIARVAALLKAAAEHEDDERPQALPSILTPTDCEAGNGTAVMGAGASADKGLTATVLQGALTGAGLAWNVERCATLLSVMSPDGPIKRAELISTLNHLLNVFKVAPGGVQPAAVPPIRLGEHDVAIECLVAELRECEDAREEERVALEAKGHEAAMPPILEDFEPLSKFNTVSRALVGLNSLEEALKAHPDKSHPKHIAALAALTAGLESPTSVLKSAIESRLAEQGIVPLCDAVISSGNDFFEKLYEETFSSIEKSEEKDLKLYQGRAQELIGCAKKGGGAPEHDAASHVKWLQGRGAGHTAMQRHSDVPSLYAAALGARGGFAAVLEKLKAKVSGLGSAQHPVQPGPVKRTARILEKVLLQRENQGNADRVCDLVRALLVADSMAQFNNVLQAIRELHDEGAIVAVRVKDRVAHPSAGGWRDVMVNFYVTTNEDRHVCEVQIAHAKMLAARKGLDGHAIYNRVRNASELLERFGAPYQGRDFSVGAGLLAEASTTDQLKPTLSMLERATDASALPEVARTAALLSGTSFVVTDGKVSFPSGSGPGPGLSLALLLGASESIDLSAQKLKARHASLIAGYIRDSTALKHLNLYGNGLGPEGGAAIAEGLKGNTTLNSLILSSNWLLAEGGVAIAEGLKGNTNLKELDLASNELCGLDEYGRGTYTAEGITALCEGLKGSAVTSLNLDRNAICGIDEGGRGTFNAEGIAKLCEALKASAVTSLSVEKNELGVKGGKAFAAVLKDTQLTNLNVAYNRLGVESGKAFAAVLKDTQLTNLNLSGNELTNYGEDMSGVVKLAEALPQTKLTSLDLNNNAICGISEYGQGTYTAEGITKLCEALKASAVTSLSLNDNELDDSAKQAVRAAVGSGIELTFK